MICCIAEYIKELLSRKQTAFNNISEQMRCIQTTIGSNKEGSRGDIHPSSPLSGFFSPSVRAFADQHTAPSHPRFTLSGGSGFIRLPVRADSPVRTRVRSEQERQRLGGASLRPMPLATPARPYRTQRSACRPASDPVPPSTDRPAPPLSHPSCL